MSDILGPVVGIFVQRQPLKQGRAPLRQYRTDDIVGVPVLTVDADGVIGHPGVGDPILDVHHRLHPRSRDRRGRGGVSVMATGDYARLAQQVATLGLPRLIVLEGGYAVDALGANVASFLSGF